MLLPRAALRATLQAGAPGYHSSANIMDVESPGNTIIANVIPLTEAINGFAQTSNSNGLLPAILLML